MSETQELTFSEVASHNSKKAAKKSSSTSAAKTPPKPLKMSGTAMKRERYLTI
ncbi:MAG: hypothetical protein L6R39_007635 [Caloplaca ligustica]|nr:MAG: hypothetical protein L6R39_007635 [Caloplaca ligustica]